MGLSAAKLSELLGEEYSEINLLESSIVHSNGMSQSITLDDWPVLTFLRGIGFESIRLKNGESEPFESWFKRLQLYEQSYIADPESFNPTLCDWNESNRDGLKIIECKRPTVQRRSLHEMTGRSMIPPFDAPLGLESQSVTALLTEIEQEHPKDILRRFSLIVREFGTEINGQEEALDFHLRSFCKIALEHGASELLIDLKNHFIDRWRILTKDSAFVLELFSAGDAKISDFATKALLFSEVEDETLLELIKNPPAQDIEVRILKLIQFRCLNSPDHYIRLVFDATSELKRLLLPSLIPHWTPQHYDKIWNAFLETLPSGQLSYEWTVAALRSDSERFFEDLERHIFKTRLFIKTKNYEKLHENTISALSACSHPGIGKFLSKIQKKASPQVRHRIERFLRKEGGR